ncbi:MAG: hypothetical protein AMXMBFR34_32440 [Myxococcaceae bacterium]
MVEPSSVVEKDRVVPPVSGTYGWVDVLKMSNCAAAGVANSAAAAAADRARRGAEVFTGPSLASLARDEKPAQALFPYPGS